MTERLTVSGATTQRDIDKLLELSNENQFGRNEAYYKLQYYEDLEEQGRLIELPCAVEDIVYAADAEPIIPLMVSKIGVYLDGGYGGDWESLSSFGKTIFLTQEEAEAALKEADE